MLLLRFYLFGQLIYLNPTNIVAHSNLESETDVIFRQKVSKLNPYEIAFEKCTEYAKYRYVHKPSSRFVPEGSKKPKPVVKLDCVKSKPLISGGVPALLKEFPHMAVIGYSPENDIRQATWLCGGTLISDRYVLTAAHCYGSADRDARWVRLGELVIDDEKDNARPKDFEIAQKIRHPKYSDAYYYNDIMLLKLNESVKFSPLVRPVCLYPYRTINSTFSGNALITGWGPPQIGEQNSEALLKAKIRVANDDECVKTYAEDEKLPSGYDSRTMICAGDAVNGSDTCPGDSGGPLQVPVPRWACLFYQVGITSFGPRICGQKNVSSVYTKITPYIPWIQSVVWP